MRVVVQRSLKARCLVEGKNVGEIDKGLMVLVGFTEGDNKESIDYMVKKIVNLRIFDDENGVMNKSLLDVGGSILSISQFTLYGDAKKGNRPSYIEAMKGDEAVHLYELFNEKLREYDIVFKEGIFVEDMIVSLKNHGPFTIVLTEKDI